jgi:hypothetical protein
MRELFKPQINADEKDLCVDQQIFFISHKSLSVFIRGELLLRNYGGPLSTGYPAASQASSPPSRAPTLV